MQEAFVVPSVIFTGLSCLLTFISIFCNIYKLDFPLHGDFEFSLLQCRIRAGFLAHLLGLPIDTTLGIQEVSERWCALPGFVGNSMCGATSNAYTMGVLLLLASILYLLVCAAATIFAVMYLVKDPERKLLVYSLTLTGGGYCLLLLFFIAYCVVVLPEFDSANVMIPGMPFGTTGIILPAFFLYIVALLVQPAALGLGFLSLQGHAREPRIPQQPGFEMQQAPYPQYAQHAPYAQQTPYSTGQAQYGAGYYGQNAPSSQGAPYNVTVTMSSSAGYGPSGGPPSYGVPGCGGPPSYGVPGSCGPQSGPYQVSQW